MSALVYNITRKNSGMYWQEFASGKTRYGADLSKEELSALGVAFLEYAEHMGRKKFAERKMQLVRDCLHELGLSSILDQQRAISNDLANQGELIDEVEKISKNYFTKSVS